MHFFPMTTLALKQLLLLLLLLLLPGKYFTIRLGYSAIRGVWTIG